MKRSLALALALLMLLCTLAGCGGGSKSWKGTHHAEIVVEEYGTITIEINADIVLLAKNVDGVYSDDPAKNPDAVKFDEISYDEVLRQHLMVMDSTATSLSMDNHIPIILFALKDPGNIVRVVMGEKIGTVVKED